MILRQLVSFRSRFHIHISQHSPNRNCCWTHACTMPWMCCRPI